MDSSGNGDLSSAARCFDWCLQQGASVISCSFGATTFSAALQAAAQAVASQNVVLVTSAGNDGISNDATPHYPSEFSKTLPGVISVAASDTSRRPLDPQQLRRRQRPGRRPRRLRPRPRPRRHLHHALGDLDGRRVSTARLP